MSEDTQHNFAERELSSREHFRLGMGLKHAFTCLALGLVISVSAGTVRAAELTWFTSLAQAQARANAEKKSVLLFFHGSDWCPLCREMQSQVFASPEFMAYARQVLVLVDVDFPDKIKQDEALKQANAALKTRFNVGDGYPTLVLLNESGETVFQEAGYAGGGPAEVLPKLQRHAKSPAAATGSAGFKDLGVAEFAKLAANKQNVILDVRTAKEFQAGHIAAMNFFRV